MTFSQAISTKKIPLEFWIKTFLKKADILIIPLVYVNLKPFTEIFRGVLSWLMALDLKS